MNDVQQQVSKLTQYVEINLPSDSEVIISVPLNEQKCSAFIKALAPTGSNDPRIDLLGSPLVVDVTYYLLPGSTFTIFAWNTATIHIEGSEQLLKNIIRGSAKSITRPLVEYHCILHSYRVSAEKERSLGPITLVCGSHNSGKANIVRTLCNYAARAGWKPLLVDMDPSGNQMVGLPGSIGAAIVEYPVTIDETMSLSLVCTTYFVGSSEIQSFDRAGESKISAAYTHFSKMLLNAMRDRLTAHSGDIYGCSGSIVLVPELQCNAGLNFISEIIQQYSVSNVLCIGDDDMFHLLYNRYDKGLSEQGDRVRVDRLSHNFSVVPCAGADVLLPIKYSEYFLGSGATVLHPSQWSKPFSNVDVLVLKEENDQVILSSVPKDELQGIVGCIGAIYLSRSSNALQSPPLVYARIQTIDPAGVYFLTTTHFTFPSEKLTLLVGNVRWITSS